MKRMCAAAVAVSLSLCVPHSARAAESYPSIPPATATLGLEDAFQRVLRSHPDLLELAPRAQALQAERERAQLSPPLAFAATAENVLGTGAAAGIDGAELSLSLGSVFERADKRAARLALVDRELDALGSARDLRRLDLLAEVARRYLDALAAQAQQQALMDEVGLREGLLEAARKRERAGAEAATVALMAEAARLRSEAEAERAARSAEHARLRLATLWGGSDAAFDLTPGPEQGFGLAALPAVPELQRLLAALKDTPELRALAQEQRLLEARLQIARSAAQPDIEWQLGLRRLQAERDWGLIGSVSIPFGSARRAQPEQLATEAELAALQLRREGADRGLRGALIEAWSALDLAVAQARRLDAQVLPALRAAAEAAERGYRAGAGGHLEWAQLLQTLGETRRERLEASLAARRALIELERLCACRIEAGALEIDTRLQEHSP